MQRNAMAHSANIPPSADIRRSRISQPFSILSTFNVGDLVPLMAEEVLPGSTFDINLATVCRLATPKVPAMDSLFLDYYAFFVPNRLVWSHWKEFCGENNESAWTQTVDYTVPGMIVPSNGFNYFSVADYIGVPPKATADQLGFVSALPFRAYRLIWNEWFRDQNLQDPLLINFGDVETDESLATLQRACRFPDYFTTALPAPQKGESVFLPLGDRAEVYWDNSKGVDSYTPSDSRGNLIWYDSTGTLSNFGDRKALYVEGAYGNPYFGSISSSLESLSNTSDMPNGGSIVNGYADLSTATAATINNLRQAFAVQRFLERQARGGSRYREFLKAQFNVISPDATQQIPEYLGGKRIPIQINQVIQSSSTANEATPLGNTGAFSKTTDRGHICTKSFTEHGWFFLLGVVRAASGQTTQQGLRRQFSRQTLYDYYLPVFDSIGEQPIYNREIFVYGNDGDEVFGYKAPWDEYRFHPSMVSGAFRSNYTESLDFWHYADEYADTPRLSAEWIEEPLERVDRTLTVTSANADQILLNVWVSFAPVLPMSTYGVPGLIDRY